MVNTSKNHDFIIKVLRNYVKRPGIDELILMLERTDFFTAPASTEYHSNFVSGLSEHSILVYRDLWDNIWLRSNLVNPENLLSSREMIENLKDGEVIDPNLEDRVNFELRGLLDAPISISSIVICGILHDCHKINCYEKYDRAIFKGYDVDGKKIWDHIEAWKKSEDCFVLGLDGTNSNYIINSCLKLTFEEQIAIENHMGYISKMGLLPSASKAWSNHKLALMLHVSDMNASYLLEESGQKYKN